MGYSTQVLLISVGAVFIILIGLLALFSRFYHKVDQGKVIVRNGVGGPVVCFGGIFVVPIVHKHEVMDISVKRVEIALAKANINIRMIDQGSSEMNILVGIENEDFERAIKSIYSAFN